MADQFLFLDIETTGVKYARDKVLEIAWILTDDKFDPIHGLNTEFSTVIDHEDEWGDVWAALRKAPQVVKEMHANSLLSVDMLTLPTSRQTTEYKVRNALHDLLTGPICASYDVHLAGFSVHFDETMLRFQETSWDVTLDSLHHRHLDLSGIKLLLETKGITYRKAPNEGAHRALNDCRAAIWQARIFSELFEGLRP
jgi:oligoribonuclease (3'-5' exoribonuclease)